jgi:Fe2+ or Zn2+ uptake regulation protein
MPHSASLSIEQALREAGLRVTSGRIALLRLFQASSVPIGTPVLAKKLVPASMDLVTLYRTLASLEEKGLIRAAHIDDRHASYEWSGGAEHHHHHLVCRSCKRVEDIPDCDLEKIQKTLLKTSKMFDQITSHSLEFFGVCRECAKRGYSV